MTDLNALVARMQAGDDSALDEILADIQPQLYRYSMSMCRHPEDAEDVLQESMFAVAKALREFRGDAKLSTWLYTIARSFCIKQRRRSKFAPAREDSLDDLTERNQLEDPAPDPQQQVEVADMWAKVQAILETLPESAREVLVLRDIQGLTAPEVSEILGIKVGAVKSRLHRARALLREGLAGAIQRRPGCPDIRQVFSEHLEGDLSPEVCASMESHVAGCPDCDAECRGLRDALNACSTARCDVPAEVQARVKAALLGAG